MACELCADDAFLLHLTRYVRRGRVRYVMACELCWSEYHTLSQGDPMPLALLVNDHRGNDTGYAEGIDIRDGASPVLSLRDGHVRCYVRHTPDRGDWLRFGRRLYPLHRYVSWYGNWCWDCAWLEAEHIVEIVNVCQERGWSCEEGEASLFDAYEAGPITLGMLRRAMLPAREATP
jgi:hypothetical protein